MSKNIWLNVLKDIYTKGIESSPRGQRIKELLNYSFEMHPINDKFCSFKERKLSLSYNFGEFAWYLTGDRDDSRIVDYSDFWSTIKNENSPYFNSNYGYYIFREGQFNNALNTLILDKDSRQASIIINRKEVLMSNSKDKLCTNTISFFIRNNKLNMMVNMRSSDAIWGLGCDVNMFSFIYEFMYNALIVHYKDLQIGVYYQNADSLHIYDKHFKMVESILKNDGKNYYEIDCPRLSNYGEAIFLKDKFPLIEESIRKNVYNSQTVKIYDSYKLTQFMVNEIMKRWYKS